ncbi:hypothetical protein RSAG8_07462, partial [Rhizoctonia solani AG-8 WAC10335]
MSGLFTPLKTRVHGASSPRCLRYTDIGVPMPVNIGGFSHRLFLADRHAVCHSVNRSTLNIQPSRRAGYVIRWGDR